MGSSWQTSDQKAFLDEHLAAFTLSRDKDDLKSFWSTVMFKWFERWPLSEPPAEFVEKKGTVEKARKAWRSKRIEVSIAQGCSVRTRTYSPTADKEGLQDRQCRERERPKPPPRRRCPEEEVRGTDVHDIVLRLPDSGDCRQVLG